MIVASKLIPLFVYPLSLAVFLLLGILLFRFRKSLVKLTLFFVITMLVVSGNRLVSNQFLWQLESDYTDMPELREADVILVLGGGTEPPAEYRPIPEISGSGDRVIYAYTLYRDGYAGKILVSGGGTTSAAFSEARSMSNFLQMLGVPANDILEETESFNTNQNAANSKKILLSEGFSDVILVTSAYHMRRASLVFDRASISFQQAPTDFRAGRKRFSWLNDVFPEARYLADTTLVIKEYLGYWFLRIKP